MAEEKLTTAAILKLIKDSIGDAFSDESLSLSTEQIEKFKALTEGLSGDWEQIGKDSKDLPDAVDRATDALEQQINATRKLMREETLRGDGNKKRSRRKMRQMQVEKEQYEDQIKALQRLEKEAKRNDKSVTDQINTVQQLGTSVTSVFRDIVNFRRPSFDSVVSVSKGFKKLGFGITKVGVAFGIAAGLFLVGLYAMVKAVIGVIKNVVKLTLEVDKFSSSVRMATGATREFTDVSTKAWRQTGIGIGVSADQAAQATRSLYKSYTDFSRLPAATRASVEELSNTFLGLGMSAEQIANQLDIMTKGFGMTSTQANSAFRELRAFSEAANIDFGLMNEQFAQAGPLLTKYDDAIGTFKRLSAASKITGMEMDKITRIATQFDTFDGAASQAGRLNAALGGNFVNAMELMMETDPVERFKMIRDSILDTGLAYEDMSYYQRQFYVGAIDGIDTTDDLKRMLTGTSQEMDKLAKAGENEVKSMAQLKEIAFDMLPVMDKLSELFKILFKDVDVEVLAGQLSSFATALVPLVEGLGEAIGLFTRVSDIFNLKKLPGRAVGTMLPGPLGSAARAGTDVSVGAISSALAGRAAAGTGATGTANQAPLEKRPFEIPIILNGNQLGQVAGEFIGRELMVNIFQGG